ncbi:hypothetical protein GCM10011487_34740 [Steroidobacter agaridevorans]|uniref:DUF899 domain-containing protein n=1 Tax=Steroidobacter agaridevorans TaxID=2695856 RepID=A0A829YDT0_9GAMM|nr:DUF899 family protein [Steroidobacter agaridevorans]GFE81474.1 hypothetical protein GCM10011487_34740 [Steroidobacter agaridevorans]
MKETSATASGKIPSVADRRTFQSQIDSLRIREKQHKKAGDAIAAARRRLPMVEVDGSTPLISDRGEMTLLDAFEGRRMLIAYYFMWHHGQSAADQCEGCALYTAQVREVSLLQSRDITYATFCQGPYEASARYRKFMGWELPWYSVQGKSLDALLAGRRAHRMYLICYLRQGSKVFETYWTTGRGVEVVGNNYSLMDLTVYGRQEWWEDSPEGWPQAWKDDENNNPYRVDGRPIVQWPRVRAGHSDDLGTP